RAASGPVIRARGCARAAAGAAPPRKTNRSMRMVAKRRASSRRLPRALDRASSPEAPSPSPPRLITIKRLDPRHEPVARLHKLRDVSRELLALAERTCVAGDLGRPCKPQRSERALLDS